ncbi:hypothetical protein [Actinoplanes aureus]|uniref:Uncharacterized protein n=1 Tax=Actinoplanes aureus TaxID=2792083 RepID=A0A931FWM3_9ACTN|nr:hypothetical protein [Actinoplanes aureus]MBG0561510.1 hypothetical protein [Actinoplanes aureus]
MATTHDVPAGAARRRLHRSAALHGLAVVIFGLMLWSGVDLSIAGARALGVPMLIAGAAGSAGALIIMLSVLRRRRGTPDQRAARIGMAFAAVATVAVGVALAPDGWERGFVISVNAFTGGLLAAFAALAGER